MPVIPPAPVPAVIEIVGLRQRPDLVPQVAAWLWGAFWRDSGSSLEETLAVVAAPQAITGPQQSFVLLDDGLPAGTASLAAADLEERPGLTPWLARWLAGVFVRPEARGQGHGARLVRAVEAAARAAGAPQLWLYTGGDGALYRRLGWVVQERVAQGAGSVLLMRRTL